MVGWYKAKRMSLINVSQVSAVVSYYDMARENLGAERPSALQGEVCRCQTATSRASLSKGPSARRAAGESSSLRAGGSQAWEVLWSEP